MVDIKNNGILLRTYIYLMISLEKFRHGKYGIIHWVFPILSGPKPVGRTTTESE